MMHIIGRDLLIWCMEQFNVAHNNWTHACVLSVTLLFFLAGSSLLKAFFPLFPRIFSSCSLSCEVSSERVCCKASQLLEKRPDSSEGGEATGLRFLAFMAGGNYLPWRHCLSWRATYRMHSCASQKRVANQNMTSDNLAAKRKLEWPFGIVNLLSTHAKTCWNH